MLDMPLEAINLTPKTMAEYGFNPSYAGYASGSIRITEFSFHTSWVSILLMLDMPLEDSSSSWVSRLGFSFNPSYAGYASGSQILSLGLSGRVEIQSFLCWICLWKN